MADSCDQPRALKARYVFPVAGEPLRDGVVTIEGGRIVEVGLDFGRRAVDDLGNVAILPGLVNAHTHLEFSDLARPVGEPGICFADWVRQVVRLRADRWDAGGRPVEHGLRESARLGTTTLGEIAQPGWPVDQVEGAGLDTTVFLELIAPATDRVAPAMELAEQHLRCSQSARCWHPGISPHAPYSIHPELLALAVSLLRSEDVPLAFHLAESPEELELLHSGSGPLCEFLTEMNGWNPTAVRLGTRPLDYLRMLAPARRTLIIHGNYLDDEEIAFLADRAERMSVVYCPRTHTHLNTADYPLASLLSAGVAVGLGTDSRASSPDLSMLAEMRFVARRHPAVAPKIVLELGTIRTARALGRDRETGSLEPGKRADLAVVGLPDRDAADPHELLFDSREPVTATWLRGRAVALD